MLINEILTVNQKHENGTYVCAKLKSPYDRNLHKLVTESLKEFPEWEQDTSKEYHCTVVYSSVPCPQCETYPWPESVGATLQEYALFGRDRNILVIKIHSPALEQLHKKIADSYGADFDWPQYSPHITVAKLPEEEKTKLDLISLNRKLKPHKITFDKFEVAALETPDEL